MPEWAGKPPTVIGHDPGREFGITVLRADKSLVTCGEGTLKCEGPSRLLELFDWVEGFIVTYRPDLYVLEDYAFGGRMHGAGAFTTGEMGGVVRMICAAREIPLVEINPMHTLMFITGKGIAKDKSQTVKHVLQQWGVDCQSSHAAEGYGLARLGINLVLGAPVDVLSDPQQKVVVKYRGQINRTPGTSGVPPKQRGKQSERLRLALEHFDERWVAENRDAHRRAAEAAQEAEKAARAKVLAERRAERKSKRNDPSVFIREPRDPDACGGACQGSGQEGDPRDASEGS